MRSGRSSVLQGDTRLTEWEVATGSVLGAADGAAVVGDPSCGGRAAVSALAVIERAVLPALMRPPCMVSFSGGMDSSFVLAVAVRAARRHGLPDPVPVSWHVSAAPAADESARQAVVLAELRIVERVVLQAGDDLDFVGPVATRVLHRYGLLYPANLHLHLPILDLAGGGSLLTGVGGDQVLSAWTPRPSSVRSTVRDAVPVALRARRLQHRRPAPWLAPNAARELLRRRLTEARSEPPLGANRVTWQLRRRNLVMALDNLSAVAGDHDVRVVHALLDNDFHHALRLAAGTRALSREQLLELAADSRLPRCGVAASRQSVVR